MALEGKRLIAKVRDTSGVFIDTLAQINLTSAITEVINQGFGTVTFSIPAVLGQYGEGGAIWYNNDVQLVVIDMDSGSDGVVIFSGYILDWQESSSDNTDTVEVTLAAYGSQLFSIALKDGQNAFFKTVSSGTAIQETLNDAQAREIADVQKRIIDLYRAEEINPKINYSATSVQNTGSTITYTWAGALVSDALKHCLDFAPANWFTRITPENIFVSSPKPSTATHLFVLGKHFQKYSATKQIDDMLNYIPFSNGDTEPRIFKIYSDTTSRTLYGTRAPEQGKIVDNRIKSIALADQKMNALLAERKDPIIKIVLHILDNNYTDTGVGYDIESIFVGDTCTIEGLDDLNSQAIRPNLTIIKTQKTLDGCVVELEGVRQNSSVAVIKSVREIAEIQGEGVLPRIITGTDQAFNLTLQNSWTNLGSGFADAQFWKDKEGRVYIWGLINRASAPSTDMIIAQLPPAFRPANNEIFATVTNGDIPIRVDIRTDGNIYLRVRIDGGAHVAGHIALNFGFYTVENTNTVNLDLINNWRSYVDDAPGDPYLRASLYKSPTTGIVYAMGLAANGTANAAITRVTEDFCTLSRAIFNTVINNVYRNIYQIGRDGDGSYRQLYSVGAAVGSQYLSLSNAHWLANAGSKYQRPTLTGGAVVYASTSTDPEPWGRPGYYIDEFGFCHLEGLVAGSASGNVAFTLPVEARPKKQHLFMCPRSGNLVGRVDVLANGQVITTVSSTDWISLYGIVFPVF